jgi:hypothetical protein
MPTILLVKSHIVNESGYAIEGSFLYRFKKQLCNLFWKSYQKMSSVNKKKAQMRYLIWALICTGAKIYTLVKLSMKYV